MRIRVLAACAAVVLSTVSCGEDPAPAGAPAAERKPALAADEPWLVRLETGTSEVASGVTYIRVTPSTGETVATSLKQGPQDYTPNYYLLVDAERSFAIASTAASIDEEASGRVMLHSLTGAPDVDVDLRAVTGVADLKPIAFAFDPDRKGLLRVLDGTGRLFEYDVAKGTAKEAETVLPRAGFEIGPMFNSETGLPVLRNSTTWEFQKGGAYSAGDVELIDGVTGVCPTATALTRALVDASGTSWAACLEGRQVRVARHAKGETEWEQVGVSTDVVPPSTMSMTWLLPPL